jgi:hypothetical protein
MLTTGGGRHAKTRIRRVWIGGVDLEEGMVMRRLSRVLLLTAVACGVLAGPAFAQITVDQSRNMAEIFTSPNQATNSDLAFWGNHAFVGYYTGDTGFPAGSGPRGGVRIFDVSNPASPRR